MFTCYKVEPELTLNFHYLDNNGKCANNQSRHFALLALCNDSIKACIPLSNLQYSDDDRISNCEIDIPLWIQSLCGYKPARESVKSIIEVVPSKEIDTTSHITLQYTGYYSNITVQDSYKLYMLPSNLKRSWPTHSSLQFSPSLIESFLPSLLHGKLLCQNSYVTINFLDTILLFHVFINVDTADADPLHPPVDAPEPTRFIYCNLSSKSLPIKVKFDILPHIDIPSSKLSNTANNELTIKQQPHGHRNEMTVLKSCDLGNIQIKLLKLIETSRRSEDDTVAGTIIDNITSHRYVPRSILLSGPQGCGKSYILQAIQQQLLVQTKPSPYIFISLSTDTLKLNTKSQSTFNPNNNYNNSGDDEHVDVSLLSLLNQFINMFEVNISQSKTLFDPPTRSINSTNTDTNNNINSSINANIVTNKNDDNRNNNNNNSNNNNGAVNSLETLLYNEEKTPCVVLMIENIDKLLFSPLFHTNDSLINDNNNKVDLNISNNMELSVAYSEASLLLRVLLSNQQSINSNYSHSSISNLPLIILGTTYCKPATLPQHHTGAPMFEKVLCIPRPTCNEREIIIYSELYQWHQIYNIHFETIKQPAISISNSNSNHTSKNSNNQDNSINNSTITTTDTNDTNAEYQHLATAVMTDWSKRIAGLTRGYLPKDILTILHKVLLNQQQQHHQQQYMNQDKSIQRPITIPTINSSILLWRSMLNVISSSSPTSLQGISTSSSSHQIPMLLTNDDALLAWDQFGGYTTIINKLKQYLNRIEKILTFNNSNNNNNKTSLNNDFNSHNINDNNNSFSLTNSNNSNRNNNSSNGIVLYGPSGCGKTFLASIIAKQVCRLCMSAVIIMSIKQL